MDRLTALPWVAATTLLLAVGLGASPRFQRTADAAARNMADLAPSRRVVDVDLPAPPTAEALGEPSQPFRKLRPLHFININSEESADVALFTPVGRVDESAAARLDTLLADARDPKHPEVAELDRRLLELVYRAAYHFHSGQVTVISAYRKPGRLSEGQHARGAAIDFKMRGVAAAVLADYLRKTPRAGVGLYTHPKTQFVHLDVREQSYHWIDSSGPGRQSLEHALGRTGLAQRDAHYTPTDDWPEGF